MKKKRCTAIVLAGGKGTRMGADVSKQFLHIGGKPLIYYSLHAFEQSDIIDDVILVTEAEQVGYVQREIVRRYGFGKVDRIVAGGKERYDSVWEGLKVIAQKDMTVINTDGFVFIHDCARPFVDDNILQRAYEGVCKYRACVVGMPSKDTVKLTDGDAFARDTPNRNHVWIIQTPQVFETSLIIEAYSRLMREECIKVTDDAMAVEMEMKLPVKMIAGSYENIKVTTPEDLEVAGVFLKRRANEIGINGSA